MTEPRQDWQANDLEGRRAAQCEFRRPVVLEAGAGTGKTTTLVARILGWCLGSGWDDAAVAAEAARDTGKASTPLGDEQLAIGVLQGLVALTYTEAAAAEMASRVAEALARVAGGREDEVVGLEIDHQSSPPSPPERVGRARALLGNLDHLTATTIHSYCLGLLLQHPLEAGVHPYLKVDAEASVVEEIIHEVLEARLSEAWIRNDPGDPLIGLAAAGIGPREIAESALALLTSGMPAGVLGADPLGVGLGELIRELGTAVDAVADQLLPQIRQLGGRSRAPDFATAIDATRSFLADFSASGAVGITALRDHARETWQGRPQEHLAKWAKQPPGARERQAVGNPEAVTLACRELRPVLKHIQRLDAGLLDLGRRALAPLLQTVEQTLQSRGVATFPFLLARARELLATDAPLRRKLRHRIRQLLVDEFQDTDGLQCEIIRHLALSGNEDERPGLFLVGDPKQSIFGWRSADLAAYDDFKNAVQDAGGAVHSLHLNFRSVAPILEEVERVVEPVMVAAPRLQPPFAPLLVSDRLRDDPGFTADGRRPVEYWVTWLADLESPTGRAAKTNAEPGSRLEAAAVASDIRSLHDRHQVAWSEIALLFRTSGRMETYLGSLRDAGVPFDVTKDKQYYQRREVIEAAAVLRAVINPADHPALLSYLRSPAAGLPDAALLPLWRGGFPGRMTELTGPGDGLEEIGEELRRIARRLPPDLPGLDRIPGWQESVIAAVRALAVLRRAYVTEPIDLFLDQVRRHVLLEATEAARYLGPYRLANLDRFFRGVELEMKEQSGNARAILRAIQRKVQEAREEDEARPKESVANAVQVMTIHGAKGLEFEHVYFVATDAGSGGRPRAHDFDERWSPEGAHQYRILGAPTLGFHHLEARRSRVAAAEQVRTLYVAATRACRRLVICGRWPDIPTPKPWDRAGSHLDLLQSHDDLPESLEQFWDDCVDAGESSTEHNGVLWVFPALAPPARQQGPGTSPTVTATHPFAAVVRQIGDLQRRRESAARRMSRPFSESPSRRAAHDAADAGEEPDDLDVASEATEQDRAVARLAGTAVHWALETWDFSAESEEETERQRRRLEEIVTSEPDPEVRAATLVRAGAILDRLSRGELLRRLSGLAASVVARELAMVLAPGEDDAACGYISGFIDLLYRDPGSGRLTIADFKTDRVEGPEELAALRDRYAPQMELYRRAVAGVFPDEPAPGCELWVLWADELLVI